MKKALIAVAMLGAMGAASAQSAVTLFGLLDAAVTWGGGSVSSKSQLTSGSNTPSRLGFRGVEDLGGDMSAGFWLEGTVQNDNGLGGATTTNNQSTGASVPSGFTFNRQATVSLKDSWGEVLLGRDVTPQVWNQVLFDPFSNIGVGASQAYIGYKGLYSVPAVVGVDTRASNTIDYKLPANLGGLNGQIMHWLGENPSNAANASDGTGTGLRVGYDNGPVRAAIATARTTYVAGNVATTNIAGSYDFGVAKVVAIYDRTKGGLVTGTGYLIGGYVPVGAGRIKISYSGFKTDQAQAPKSTKLALGYEYYLSKRTALYTNIAYVRNGGGANQSLGGSVTAANGNSSGLDIGIKHSF